MQHNEATGLESLSVSSPIVTAIVPEEQPRRRFTESIGFIDAPPAPRTTFQDFVNFVRPTRSPPISGNITPSTPRPQTSGPPRGVLESFVHHALPNASVACDNAADLTTGLLSLLPELERMFTDTHIMMNGFCTASTSITSLTNSVQKVVDSIPVLKEISSSIVDIVVLFIDCAVAWWNGLLAMIPTLVYRILNLFGIAGPLIDKFISYIASFFGSKESTQGQEGLIEPQSTEPFMTIASMAFGLICTRKMPDSNRLRYVNEFMRFKGYATNEIKDLKDMLIAICRRLPTELSMWFSYVMPADWWAFMFSPNGRYYGWLDDIERIYNVENKSRATHDKILQREIIRLYKDGVDIVKSSHDQGTRLPQIGLLLKRYLDKIEELYQIVDLATTRRGGRETPFCVYLFGTPGTGKSFMSTIIPEILAHSTPDVEYDKSNLIYPRNPFNPYWDGYTKQFATLFEDFAMLRGVIAPPGEYGEFTLAVSNVDYPLIMADLKDKGMMFNSHVVMVTSNTAYPEPNEMNHKTALWRRRHVLAEVTVKTQFCKPGKLEVDPSKIPGDQSHYQFRLFDPSVNQPISGILSYDEFIDLLVEKYQDHRVMELQNRRNARAQVQTALDRRNFKDALEYQPQLIEAQADGDDEVVKDILKTHKHKLLSESIMEPPERTNFAAELLVGSAAFVATDRLLRLCEELRGPVPSWVRVGMRILPFISLACGMVATYMLINYFSKKKVTTETTITTKMTPDGPLTVSESHPISRSVYKSKTFEAEGAYNNVPAGRLSKHTIIRNINKGRSVRNIRSPQVITSESTDSNALEILNKLVTPNLCKIVVGTEGIYTRNNTALYVKGQTLLTVSHVFCDVDGQLFNPGTPIKVMTQTEVFNDLFDHDRFVKIGEDTVLYSMNINSRSFRDITKHFILDAELDTHRRFKGATVTLSSEFQLMAHYLTIQGNAGPIYYYDTKFKDEQRLENQHYYEQFTCWSYNLESRKGDCGSPLLAFDPKMPRKLVGIHIGSGDTAFGEAVTYEMINEAFQNFSEEDDRSLTPNGIPQPMAQLIDIESAIVLPIGNFQYMGCLPKPIFSPKRTALQPSPIYEQIYNHSTEPSVLSPTDPRLKIAVHPLVNGVEKYGKVMPPMDASILKEIEHYMIDLFNGLERTLEPLVISEYESINGCNTEFSPPLVMSTSPGYPYNQRATRSKGKAWLFEQTATHTDGSPLYEVSDSELRQRLDYRWTAGLRGERVPSLWIDTLKDELRPIEKIENGKTRVFTIPPVDMSIVARRLFQSFVSMFYENKNKFFSAVGISCESEACNEWTKMHYDFVKKSPIGFAGDYSSFDGTLHPQVMDTVCNIINAWYNDDFVYRRFRKVIFNEIIHTCQVAMNCVYVTNCGNPSGNWITTPLNTISGAIYLRYGWLKLAPARFRSLQHFDEHVTDRIYGDDNKLAVTNVALVFFNPEALTKVFSEFGVVYTSTTKDGTSPIEPIMDMTFLKRGSRKGRGMEILPTMDKKTIQELTNWIRKSDDDEAMLVNNLNESLRFAFFHGREYFDEHRRAIMQEIKPNLKHKILTYAYFYAWVYDDSVPKVLRPVQIEPESAETTGVSTTNTQGVLIMSQRGTTQDSETPGKDVLPNRLATAAISEMEWKLSDMTGRRALAGVYAFNSTDTTGHTYVRMSMPNDALVQYFQTAAFERFYAWNGPVRAHIQINGTRFHAGRLIAYFVPGTELSVTQQWHELPQCFPAKTAVPNVQIDASANNVGVLEMNYHNIRSYLTLNNTPLTDNNFIGSFLIQVLNPLSVAGTTSPAVSFSLWFEFPDPQHFQIPRFTAGVTVPFNAQHFNLIKGQYELISKFESYEQFNEWCARGNDFNDLGVRTWNYRIEDDYDVLPKEIEPQGNSGSVTNNTTVKNYGHMNDMALQPVAKGDEISTKVDASIPTMDKPGYTLSGLMVYRSPFQYLCNTKGTDCLNRLTLDQSSLNKCTTDHFSTSKDETRISTLTQLPTMVSTLTWNASDASGHILWSNFIGPMGSFPFYSGAIQATFPYSPTVSTEVNMSLFDYICLPHRFWRGTYRIRFDIIASQMHEGLLWAAPHYGQFTTLTDGIVDATSQYGLAMDLQNQQKTFFLDIPYKAPTQWLEVNTGGFDANYTGGPENQFMGLWSLRVLNLLKAPDNAPPNVQINVSICGGPDFELYYPEGHNATFTPLSAGVSPGMMAKEIKPESEEVSDDAAPVPTYHETAAPTPAIVISPSGPSRKVDTHFNEPFLHMGDYFKRYVPSFDFNGGYLAYVDPTAAPPGNDYGFTLCNTDGNTASWLAWYRIETRPVGEMVNLNGVTLPSGTFVVQGANHPLGRMAHIFRQWRGSMRFKIVWGNITTTSGGSINYSNHSVFFTSHNRPWSSSALALVDNVAQPMLMTLGPQAQCFEQNYLPASTTYTGPLGFQVPASLAINVCPQGLEFHEIEIPFTTSYNSLYTNANVGNALTYPRVTTQGTLYATMCFTTSSDSATVTDLKTKGLNWNLNVYRAAGDDFRFGVLLGPPRCVALPSWSKPAAGPAVAVYSSWPDQWAITNAASPVPGDKAKLLQELLELEQAEKNKQKETMSDFVKNRKEEKDILNAIKEANKTAQKIKPQSSSVEPKSMVYTTAPTFARAGLEGDKINVNDFRYLYPFEPLPQNFPSYYGFRKTKAFHVIRALEAGDGRKILTVIFNLQRGFGLKYHTELRPDCMKIQVEIPGLFAEVRIHYAKDDRITRYEQETYLMDMRALNLIARMCFDLLKLVPQETTVHDIPLVFAESHKTVEMAAEAKEIIPESGDSDTEDVSPRSWHGMVDILRKYEAGGPIRARSVLNELSQAYPWVEIESEVKPVCTTTSITFDASYIVYLFAGWKACTGIATGTSKTTAREMAAVIAIGECLALLTTKLAEESSEDLREVRISAEVQSLTSRVSHRVSANALRGAIRENDGIPQSIIYLLEIYAKERDYTVTYTDDVYKGEAPDTPYYKGVLRVKNVRHEYVYMARSFNRNAVKSMCYYNVACDMLTLN
jgi:hypothetical protein